jgi:hypothetical protein
MFWLDGLNGSHRLHNRCGNALRRCRPRQALFVRHGDGRRGDIIRQGKVASEPEPLLGILDHNDQELAVAMEASRERYWVCDLLGEAGIEVSLVHPLNAKAIASARVKRPLGLSDLGPPSALRPDPAGLHRRQKRPGRGENYSVTELQRGLTTVLRGGVLGACPAVRNVESRREGIAGDACPRFVLPSTRAVLARASRPLALVRF